VWHRRLMTSMRHVTRGRDERDEVIRQARAQGASIDELVAECGVGRRQVQRILAGKRTSPPPVRVIVTADPVEELEGVLEVHSQVLTELEELCRSTRHDGVKLGALKARADLATQRFEVFRAVPALRNEAEARDLLDRFLAIVGRHPDLPLGFIEDLVAITADAEPRSETH
jgi:transcriptional regulator with XRE-family HTH domain